jgi:hypothetical protein
LARTDLAALLQVALPKGPRFPDWRHGPTEELAEQLDAPREGVLFDVEHNNIWCPGWGEKPSSVKSALDRCSELIADAPKLIPVYGHRYIVSGAEPHSNPVLSVHQTDIIVYGATLEQYLLHEFLGQKNSDPLDGPLNEIEFWGFFLG